MDGLYIHNNKSAEGWAITYFVLSRTNNLDYIIHVRSFYLSTLISRLFRETLIAGLLKLLPENWHQYWNAKNQNTHATGDLKTRRATGASTQRM